MFGHSAYFREEIVGDRFTTEFPDHGSKFEVGREAEPVVDGPDMVVGVDQTMTALAVGVVGHHVEHRDAAELFVELRAGFEEREVVLGEIGLHEPLERTGPERSVSFDGWWHDVQTHRLRQPVGGDLAAKQSGWEVPQRAFPSERFVDRLALGPLGSQRDEERRVAAVGHATLHFDVAGGEQFEG